MKTIKNIKNIVITLICITMLAFYVPQTEISYAAPGDISAELIDSSPSGNQGERTIISYKISNERNRNIKVKNIKLKIEGGGVSVSENTGEILLKRDEHTNISFTVSLDKYAPLGSREMKLTADLFEEDGITPIPLLSTLSSRVTMFTIYEKFTTDVHDTETVIGVDVTHNLSPNTGFVVGDKNKLRITVYNYGNSVIKNGIISLNLPAGMTIYNASNQANIGYLSTEQRKTVDFPISVEKGTVSKNYPIEVIIAGQDYFRKDVKAQKTIYIPVKGEEVEDIKNDLSISNIYVPENVKARTPFDLSFSVTNSGKSKLRSIKIHTEQAEGLLNKSRNIFIDNFEPGQTKTYTVSYYAQKASEDKSYSIKITAEQANSDSKNPVQISQYAVVNVEGNAEAGDTKKPQLMVDNYSYGGTAVQAGSTFILNLGILNTSAKELSNIKISLSDDGGVFVPANGSNSFFVEKIKGKAHYTKSLAFDVKPQAEQKTTPITVKMTYESGGEESFESSDTISIPVTQKTRLVVDEFIPPLEAYVGMPVNCELQFYNMGKTVLNNLKINCEGEFNIEQSNSYYAGNMETGKSDTYNFSIIPKDVGPVTGKIIFAFEDSEGEAQLIEVPFEFEAMEEPPFDDMGIEDEQPKKKFPWSIIIFGAVVAGLIAGGIVFKKIRKRKLDKALEIEDMDIEDNPGDDDK